MSNRNVTIRVPPKMLPLFTKKSDYYNIYGGRGGGKSWAVAVRLVTDMLSDTHFVVCGRETQKRISDSSFKLIWDTICRLELQSFFTKTKEGIACPSTNSVLVCMGFRDKPDGFKSCEGATRLWIEEAQQISKDVLEALGPTMRRDNAQMIFTYNPKYPTDAVDAYFRQEAILRNTTTININWRDNPWHSAKMERERLACKEADPFNYPHIWEGKHKEDAGENAVLPLQMLNRCVGIKLPKMWGEDGRKFAGIDVADGGKDSSAYATRQGSVILTSEIYNLADTALLADRVIPKLYEEKVASVYYDANGVGAGLKAEFAKRSRNQAQALPFSVNPFFAQAKVQGGEKKYVRGAERKYDRTNAQFFWRLKDQAWWNVRQRLVNTCNILDGRGGDLSRLLIIDGGVSQKDTDELLQELSQASYTTNTQEQIVVDKQPDGRDSPNRADSVIMAFCNDLRKGLIA